MKHSRNLTRLGLAVVLLASLGACTVVPAYPAGYRAAPVYVESYPAYRPAPPVVYYGYERGYRDDRGRDYYREDRRYDERRYSSPLEEAARVHRDVRRSLGLPRLPGMP